jgi:hypothetical protein
MADPKLPASPERYHEDNHLWSPFEECRRCQRARAICRSKRSYASWAEADVAVREVNERESYASPVTRYRCRWCLLWHLTTARRTPQRKRMEKQRRKWLARSTTPPEAALLLPNEGS